MQAVVGKIYQTLHQQYGPQGWWPIQREYKKREHLTPEEQFEICVGAILTQNTAWKNVQKALEQLRQHDALTKDAIRTLSAEQLAQLIRSSGYHNQKAKKLKAFIAFLDSGKEITRAHLLEVWGLGNETVDSMLLYAYQEPVFVIDAYTKRIFARLGLCDEKTSYPALQALFHEHLPKDHQLFNEYHALLVEHAKRFCKKEPACKECPLQNICNYGQDYLRKRPTA